MRNTIKLRSLTMAALLGAIGFILMLLEFSIPALIPDFVKMDLSDIPALIGTFAMGPVVGVWVCIIKNLLHLFVSQSGGVGEVCNALLGIAFVLPAGLIYRHNKTRKGAMLGSLIGALLAAAVSIAINYYIIYPFYSQFFPIDAILALYRAIDPSVTGLFDALVRFNAPFTFLKEALCTLVTLLIYKKLSPILKGN